jgi:hypothetical protein
MTKRQCLRKLILAILADERLAADDHQDDRISRLLIEIDAAYDNGDDDVAFDLETELDEALE